MTASETPDSALQLEIEFQRVQTFLFKVPRLADMDGANALLGDLVRRQLPLALQPYLAKSDASDDTQLAALRDLECDLAKTGDPLIWGSEHDTSPLTPYDTPSILIAHGLLVRDGGRVWARTRPECLEQAKAKAAAAIQSSCPGLGYTIRVRKSGEERSPQDASMQYGTDLIGLPCFCWSEDGGDEPASEEITIGKPQDPNQSKRRIARSSVIKRNARADRDAFWDVASLLYAKHTIPRHHGDNDTDFEHIADGRYLAVVHMDGNAIGTRSQAYARQSKDAAGLEAFFLSMRSAMRRAVTAGLNTHFKDCADHYRLLMLGGDDVLIVCRADKALPLVHSVAATLADIPLQDGEPLTIGAGVAIAKPNLPFFRLHQLAEELARSAKRVALDQSGKRRSVVDWMVATTSWVDDIDDHRTRWECVRYRVAGSKDDETLLLTGKPYPVLACADEPSLGSLLDLSESLRREFFTKEKAERNQGMRSQLKWMLGELRKGRHYAELVWSELPEAFRTFLSNANTKGLRLPAQNGAALWQAIDNATYRSWLADLIELVELPQIGARRDPAPTRPHSTREGASA